MNVTMNRFKTRAATLTLATLLSAPAAFAAEDPEVSRMPAHIGFGSGMLAGAVVGGPIGAIIGGAMGTMIGSDSVQQAELSQVSGKLDTAHQELADARQQLDAVNQQLARKRHEVEQARGQLAALENNHGQLQEWVEGLRLAVYFDHDSSTVKEHYQRMLSSIGAHAGKLPGMRIDLEGRSNKSGPADYNVQLSKERSAQVAARLKAQGVRNEQIVATPLGAVDAPADRLYAPEQRRVDLMFRFEEQQKGLASTR